MRVARARDAAAVLVGPDTPDEADIIDAAAGRLPTTADEPALQTAALEQPANTDPASTSATAADVDLPITSAVVSTAPMDLDQYRHVAALAGLLAQDTAAVDFDADLDQLLDQLAHLRRS